MTEASHETSILRSVRKKIRRNMSILKVRSVKMVGKVSRETLVLMLQHVSSRVAGLCGAVAVQNLSSLKVSKQAVMSFCVAGVALRDFPTCFMMCQKSFCVAGAILSRRFQKMRCIFGGRRNTLKTSDIILAWQAQHFRRVVLRIFCKSHCQGCAKW